MHVFQKLLSFWTIITLLLVHCTHSDTLNKKTSTNKKTFAAKFLVEHCLDFLTIKTLVNNLNPQSRGFSVQICRSCKLAVNFFQQYLAAGASEEEVMSIVYKICSTFKIETPRVCSGLTKNFKNIFMAVGRANYSPDEICRFIYQPGCGNTTHPGLSWHVSIPHPSKPPLITTPSPPQPSRPTLRVLQITDLHLDPYYTEGSNANCKEPLCCRVTSGRPLTPKDAAGLWGHPGNCDTPLRTFESMLQHIVNTQKVDYVIYTGDAPPHDIWNSSRTEAIYLLHSSADMLQKYFKHVPVYPAIGNHESSPVNSFPVPQIKGNESTAWLYEEITKTWSRWIPHNNETLLLGSYYNAEVSPGFRIISLNTNYCNNLNWWLLLNTTDPTGQLAWLVQQLQMAEDKGEKVHIIGHIPPGDSDCVGVWSENYNKIIERYANTIAAQFFGHTHREEFEIFYEKSVSPPRPINVAYIGPSVSPFECYNPLYRIYEVDGNYPESSRVVLDYESYYLNLTEANSPGGKPEWKLRYSAKRNLEMQSLAPNDWDLLTRRMESDDKFFHTFINYTRDGKELVCNNRCKKMTICKFRRGQSNDPVFC